VIFVEGIAGLFIGPHDLFEKVPVDPVLSGLIDALDQLLHIRPAVGIQSDARILGWCRRIRARNLLVLVRSLFSATAASPCRLNYIAVSFPERYACSPAWVLPSKKQQRMPASFKRCAARSPASRQITTSTFRSLSYG
jgi:hypothetical protein